MTNAVVSFGAGLALAFFDAMIGAFRIINLGDPITAGIFFSINIALGALIIKSIITFS
jgi:hypothetical protein